MDEIDFSALLCARLCHDVISPVSAARNGVAMAQDENDPEMRAEAIALTADGLADAVNKLKVYRIAYGKAGPGTTLSNARAAAQGLFASGRVGIDWSEGGADPGPEGVRLLVNLVLLGADAVARGGTVRIFSEGESLGVEATGGRARIPDDIQPVLDGAVDSETLTPRQIQAALTLKLARRQGHTIVHAVEEGAVTLKAVPT